jgi:hypothetical protein
MKENTSVSYYCVLLYLFYCNNYFFIDFCNSNVTDDISQDNLVEEPISLTPTSSGFFIGEELNEREHFSKLSLYIIPEVYLYTKVLNNIGCGV